MKHHLLLVLALCGLLFASSCQMQEPDSGTLTGEVNFSITAGIPSGITTYTEGADAFSHQGGASNLNTSEYTLRYTLQVFDNDGKLAYEGVEYAEDSAASLLKPACWPKYMTSYSGQTLFRLKDRISTTTQKT